MKKNTDEKTGKISSSFFTGVIALVFLIIGYETALFIQRAAVAHIISNRDHPDTVYVYAGETVSSSESVSVHAPHSRQATSVRQQFADADGKGRGIRHYENFRFNPNTATIEELQSLGFSLKQAQSIDHYRQKGGKFRRKEDFAKSFVVADSVYQRLEPFIDIPRLDINLADSAAFDALPGIGGYFAARMVAHRQALKGYSCKEQLMDIRYLDAEKLSGFEDLITVSSPAPYPLWNLPADSLRLHPYIRSSATARGIILFREHHPKDQWTLEALHEARVLTDEDYEKWRRCLIAPVD